MIGTLARCFFRSPMVMSQTIFYDCADADRNSVACKRRRTGQIRWQPIARYRALERDLCGRIIGKARGVGQHRIGSELMPIMLFVRIANVPTVPAALYQSITTFPELPLFIASKPDR